ncbi:mCG147026 [Mus musculus]|nr:mCG147026 [Mus musculus]
MGEEFVGQTSGGGGGNNWTVKNKSNGAGEMAQQLRTLTVLLKVLSSNPSNHMVAHNHP